MKNLTFALAILSFVLSSQAETYSWQKPHATVLPTGDLEWAPEPFVFEAGESVRYIDYEDGSDDANGLSPETSWKHHPWDPQARGEAAACRGVHTYVFKRGTVYRGALMGRESGTEQEPIRLTSSPDWGGEALAVIAGSTLVSEGWKKCKIGDAPGVMPYSEKVWCRELSGPRPWNLWLVDDEEITRLKLARAPNWEEVDPDDRKSQWWSWPHGKHGRSERKDGEFTLTRGIDEENITFPEGALTGAFVYPEWGPVMGTPVAREIVDYDAENNTVYFKGFWSGNPDGHFGTMRYYLENSPALLDEPGEWWFDESNNRLYIRLPSDANPNGKRIEAARHGRLIELQAGTKHIEISGLAFRFTNQGNPSRRPFTTDRDVACIYMIGSGEDINIHHCRFEHINRGIKLKAIGENDLLDHVQVTDNFFSETDHGAILIEDGNRWALRNPPKGTLGHVDILRNKLYKIGQRPLRGESGHAVEICFPETAEIAGNILYRCYGAGLFIWGGKPNGYIGEAPLTRILIHHNKVVDPLLNSNDWGGIETWQGGPHYVFNNISGNPGGYWFWNKSNFGFAYYLDGSFKNYHFNNIAWGKYNEGPHRNTAAFQEIHSYQNTFFNNTVYNFAVGTRRQRPDAGRNKFIGNVWQDISEWVYWHTKPAGSADEANEAHAGKQGEEFALGTVAYARNVYNNFSGQFGAFETSGCPYETVEEFQQALKQQNALAWKPETVSDKPLLRDPEQKDFRLAPGATAENHGAEVFVPWGLYAVVGEWHFTRNNQNPEILIDDHWYMTPAHIQRDDYHQVPMSPLHGQGISTTDYIESPLENWAPGALRLDGKHRLILEIDDSHAKTYDPTDTQTVKAADWLTITYPKEASIGHPFPVELETHGVSDDQQIVAHLHWLKSDSWGGFNAWGGQAVPLTETSPHRFLFKPEERAGLKNFSLLIYTSPDGDLKNQTHRITIPVAKSAAPPVVASEQPTVDMGNNSFLIEAYLQTLETAGSITSKQSEAGYSLGLSNGNIEMTLSDGPTTQQISAPASINDGEWHHIIAEVDRTTEEVRVYVDGKAVANEPLTVTGSLSNGSNFIVGEGFKGAFDFLRVSRGSLADAKTTIDELYTWQFDGPNVRDWTGRKPADGKRDAGAIENQ